eukprot:comp19298_c0_seq1/m.22148 comp19298_c0_seq1/g.22148  ORF comp19298_c0_seq1/g.22148 comp19298_c0_seq1/m.22148 type:complete len:258 (-) comp19298_c0_seq1:291-1064(-)
MTLSISPSHTPQKRRSVAALEMDKAEIASAASAAPPPNPRRKSSFAKLVSVISKSKSTENVGAVKEQHKEHAHAEAHHDEPRQEGKLRRKSSLSTLAHLVTGNKSRSTNKLASTTSLDGVCGPTHSVNPKISDIPEQPKKDSPETVVKSIFEEQNMNAPTPVVATAEADSKTPLANNYEDVVTQLGQDLLNDFEHMFDKLTSDSPLTTRKGLIDGKKKGPLGNVKADEEALMRSSQVSLNTKLNTLDNMMTDMKEFM